MGGHEVGELVVREERMVREQKAMVRRQQRAMVMKTPCQPQWSAIQPTPEPAMAEPKT